MQLKKIELPFKIKRPILAMGPQTKNTLCFVKGCFAYVSEVHPDLNNLESFFNFKNHVKYFLRQKPKIIAYDLHPEYQATKYAQELSDIPARPYQLSAIQHHHAHIASCMAENGLKNQKVIGVAFDGTGLGIDNTLWGCEFMICDYKNYKRSAHLREIPLLGGEQAIREPWRLAAIWLYLIYKEDFLKLNIDFTRQIHKKNWRVLKDIYLKNINSPLTSSIGRLFDAVASLILVKYKARFEAELAIELERLALSFQPPAPSYRFKIIKIEDQYILEPQLIFKEIVEDLKTKAPKEKIAYRFHLTVAQMIKETCALLKKENRINKVVLSGGVFQNNLLLCSTRNLLFREGLKVLTHKNLSCSDSGISLGQALIASFNN